MMISKDDIITENPSEFFMCNEKNLLENERSKNEKNTLWEITHATRQMGTSRQTGTSGCGQEGKKKMGIIVSQSIILMATIRKN